MTDWVHCNTCFRQPAGNGPKFALTNCGHIYCSDCVESGTKDKCRMCGNPCTTITLSAKMKPDVELFFTDPAEIVRRQQKQLITVLDFQKNHRQRLTAHRREMQGQQMPMIECAKERMKEMEGEINRLREENRKLRSLVSGSPGVPNSARVAQRQLTPGRGMRNSPLPAPGTANRMAHQTPSPSKSRGSPFNRPSYPTTPTPMDTKIPMQSPHQVTPGPARFSIRTPPSGGRMGTIMTPISCTSSQPVTPKSLMIRQAAGHTPPGTPSYMSPMSGSPSSYQSRGSSIHERRSTPGPGGDGQGRKQIQLNYTPHRRPPMLSSSLSASQP